MDPTQIKVVVKIFFEQKFKEPMVNMPNFKSSRFKKVNLQHNFILEKEFSNEEIKDATWACDGDKAQVPMGCRLL